MKKEPLVTREQVRSVLPGTIRDIADRLDLPKYRLQRRVDNMHYKERVIHIAAWTSTSAGPGRRGAFYVDGPGEDAAKPVSTRKPNSG